LFDHLVDDDTKLRVDLVVERRSVLAGEGVGLVVAGKSGLVEDSLVTADERELSVFDDSTGIVFNGETHVEDLAVVVYIGVVSGDKNKQIINRSLFNSKKELLRKSKKHPKMTYPY